MTEGANLKPAEERENGTCSWKRERKEKRKKNERTRRREKRVTRGGGGVKKRNVEGWEERQEADDASLRDGIPLSG